MFVFMDEVTVINKVGGADVETIPAYVGYSLGGTVTSNHTTFNREDAVAIVEAGTVYDELAHKIRHRGIVYAPNGAPAVHYRHGEPHHVTIPVKRITAT